MLTDSMIDKKTYKALHSTAKLIPAVALVSDNNEKKIMKLINQGVHYHIVKPMKSGDLKKVLHSIANSHFSNRKLLITNKKIQKFIENLDPLNETILKIQKICSDDNSSIADLIKVVKNDPITSGLILNATQSPIYALKKIKTIDQAVTVFGKATVQALTLGGLSSQFEPYDLTTYGITETIFSNIAHLRMRLMINWYRKVDRRQLDTLSIAALLGNLGQMLIAKEIKNLGLTEKFLTAIQTKGVHEAEYDFLRTSTAAVTSDILYFWKMPSILIDAISYSDFPEDAVEEVRPLAAACQIVFTLIPLTQASIQPVKQTVTRLVKEAGLNMDHLLTAIKETNQHKD
jgi:HD-like signal output (HDOD) protein